MVGMAVDRLAEEDAPKQPSLSTRLASMSSCDIPAHLEDRLFSLEATLCFVFTLAELKWAANELAIRRGRTPTMRRTWLKSSAFYRGEHL